jgi:hypothetical protein
MLPLRSDLASVLVTLPVVRNLSIEAIAACCAADLHATTITNPQVNVLDRICCHSIDALRSPEALLLGRTRIVTTDRLLVLRSRPPVSALTV